MYEHAYRNYYNSNISYSLLRPTVIEKVFTYEEPRIDDMAMEEHVKNSPTHYSMDDLPLNLICAKRLECKPIEDLVKRTDLPLDLSTKS